MESREVFQCLHLPSCPGIVQDFNLKSRVYPCAYSQLGANRGFRGRFRQFSEPRFNGGLMTEGKNSSDEHISFDR
jgi:hypothetical protein